MSLTSYRAAPPRVNFLVFEGLGLQTRTRRFWAPRDRLFESVRGIVLGRPGNDLLSRVLRHSTISAEEFNGRVRDGIGFGLLAQVTGPAKDNGKISVFPDVMVRARTMRGIKPIEQLVPVS